MQSDLIEVCRALQAQGVRYILVGGHAVRLNGIVRATEDVDILVPFDVINGQRLIESLDFLDSAKEIDPAWFSREANEPDVENIRVADRIVVDILFAVNGETFESLQPHVRLLELEGVAIPVLNIDGLLKAKTDYREKDVLDKAMLRRLKFGPRD
jgi:predicted nucleotidyltransferase